MYIAKVKRPYKKTPDYYVVWGVYNQGKVRHEVIAALGNTPDIDKAYDKAALELLKAKERVSRIENAMALMNIEASQRA